MIDYHYGGRGSAVRLLLTTLLLACALEPADAQVPPVLGSWDPGFNHSITWPTGTDPVAPYLGNGAVPPPTPPAVGTSTTDHFYWGQGTGWFGPDQKRDFNAVHMAVIPKGPHQGKVLVWGVHAVVLKPNDIIDPQGRDWWFHAWSIIDPNAAQPRFLNYLTPLEALPDILVNVSPEDPPPLLDEPNLFCSGHAWNQEGNLVVAGGDRGVITDYRVVDFEATNIFSPPDFLFQFDPALPHARFPESNKLVYAGVSDLGEWRPRQNGLQLGRYYPTVLLSAPLARLGGQEVIMVAGGSDSSGFAELSYETYVSQSAPTLLPLDSAELLPVPYMTLGEY